MLRNKSQKNRKSLEKKILIKVIHTHILSCQMVLHVFLLEKFQSLIPPPFKFSASQKQLFWAHPLVLFGVSQSRDTLFVIPSLHHQAVIFEMTKSQSLSVWSQGGRGSLGLASNQSLLLTDLHRYLIPLVPNLLKV